MMGDKEKMHCECHVRHDYWCRDCLKAEIDSLQTRPLFLLWKQQKQRIAELEDDLKTAYNHIVEVNSRIGEEYCKNHQLEEENDFLKAQMKGLDKRNKIILIENERLRVEHTYINVIIE